MATLPYDVDEMAVVSSDNEVDEGIKLYFIHFKLPIFKLWYIYLKNSLIIHEENTKEMNV
jgi:hypothetical protein